MKFMNLLALHESKFLKKYELTYENKAGKIKKYEMVSRHNIRSPKDLGAHLDGMSIAAFKDGKLLLLKEFRMAVNREIYNLCAGMMEENESIDDCILRELYEETGLSVKKILHILPPSFSAVGISDVLTQIAFVEVSGTISDHSSENEQIKADFYTKEEVSKIISTQKMSDRAQIVAYFYTLGLFDRF